MTTHSTFWHRSCIWQTNRKNCRTYTHSCERLGRCVHDKALYKATFTLSYLTQCPISTTSSNFNWKLTGSVRKVTVQNESSYRSFWSLSDPEIVDGNNGRRPKAETLLRTLQLILPVVQFRAWMFLICAEVSRSDTITDADGGRIPTSWIHRWFLWNFCRTERPRQWHSTEAAIKTPAK